MKKCRVVRGLGWGRRGCRGTWPQLGAPDGKDLATSAVARAGGGQGVAQTRVWWEPGRTAQSEMLTAASMGVRGLPLGLLDPQEEPGREKAGDTDWEAGGPEAHLTLCGFLRATMRTCFQTVQKMKGYTTRSWFISGWGSGLRPRKPWNT